MPPRIEDEPPPAPAVARDDAQRVRARRAKPVQLGLFTGEPVGAAWVLDDGRWWCVRCLRAVAGARPKRRCSCGWARATMAETSP